MHAIISIIIIIIVCFVILLEYVHIIKLYGETDLVIDEKVHIRLVKDNYSQIVPAKIGIEPKLWKDHSLDNYSQDPHNFSPLNTKRYDGIIHIQSIYDREFTLGNFLEVWGFNKSKIIDVYSDKNKIKDYYVLPLANGQKIKLIIEDNISFENFTKYNDSKISFEYPPTWNSINALEFSTNSNHHRESLSSIEKFSDIIELFPKEFEYMDTPLFSIQISKLNSNKTIDDYYNENIHKLLEANETTFPKLLNKTDIDINNNLGLKINLNTTLIAEPGSKVIGNSINQRDLHIWIIKNSYFFDISFKVFESSLTEYYPIIQQIIESIVIK
jgi:hypothetical protein